MSQLEVLEQTVEEIKKWAEENLGKSRKFNQPTPKKHDKRRGVGVTRKSKEESKRRKKIAAKSRKINRKK